MTDELGSDGNDEYEEDERIEVDEDAVMVAGLTVARTLDELLAATLAPVLVLTTVVD